MADRIHNNPDYANVGMIQVVNEPVHSWDYGNEANYMVQSFYPNALQSVRNAEEASNVASGDRLHVQFMVHASHCPLTRSM